MRVFSKSDRYRRLALRETNKAIIGLFNRLADEAERRENAKRQRRVVRAVARPASELGELRPIRSRRRRWLAPSAEPVDLRASTTVARDTFALDRRNNVRLHLFNCSNARNSNDEAWPVRSGL